ncbi:MAG: sulfotransferase [Fuerstiella sp.]
MMSDKKTSKAARHSQGGLMLWHGMRLSGLRRLFASGPSMHWTRLHRILSLPFSGVYNSVLYRAEKLLYGRQVAKTTVEHPPLFVLGYWRSGTTFLQTLLSRDPQFQHLGLYRALFPWHFLLTEKLVTKLTAPFVPKARPMDNIKVHWDAPQEDDLSLCIMSNVSPINLLAHPAEHRFFWESLDFDKLNPADVQRWKDCLDLLVRKLTFASSRRIMMKSPYHTFHIPTLLEMYPNARFLYIHRNPYNIFRSTCHLRRRMIEENTLGRSVFDGTEEEVIQSYKYGFEKYEHDRQLIPAEHHHEICYEKLEQDPVGELRKAYEGMDLPGFEQLEAALAPEVESLKRYKKNEFVDDPFWVDRVYQELKPAFERFGYDKPQVKAAAASSPEHAAAG